ncbi:TonB-dependent receptor plug domain-containing protein [Olivibacter sp. CPCC 100613]|uniref:TonB-dependent receptor n=1 Tax=Olivibacter sp. CPCC 100613 TaxID=3079931 RepID=UPI002FF638C4
MPILAQKKTLEKAPQRFYTCLGTIKDAQGTPLQGTTVQLLKTGKKVMSNDSGFFRISDIPATSYQLQVTHLGHQPQTIPLNFKGEDIWLNIVLEDSNGQLMEVSITEKSKNRQLAEHPVLTQVVNTRTVYEQPTTLIELLNRSAGVRVRQTGGLGAPSNLMINGFQNRSIRYFKDGIPMDYLGGGFDISLVPVNMLERVEVYKGVLPPALGADALGGALNLVTKETTVEQLNAAYEIGSFNTHRASINVLHKKEDTPYFVGLDAFYNYSDNDYKADLKVVNPTTGNLYDIRAPLFHNRFKNYYAEVYAGIHDTKWADELRFGLTAFGLDRQINYGASMSQAIGAATNHQDALIPTVRYRKAFLNNRITIDQFVTANTLYVNQVDTAKGQYNWLGEFTPSDSRLGELVTRGSLAKLNYNYYTSRTHLSYTLDNGHRLDLNIVFTGFSRKGNDPFGQRFAETGVDVLARKATYNKQIYGLGITSKLLQGRLSNQLMLKYYRYGTHATDADYQGFEITHNNRNSSFGVAEAIKWDVSSNSYLRLSAETALRLPEQDELFGDGDRKLSNFALKPERSLNFNLGFRRSFHQKHALEINSFYRITRDMILQLPYNFLFSQSQNIDHVQGIGLEADAEVSFFHWLKAAGNFTYQDQRIYNTNNPSMEHARLRNTPFFFANASLNAFLKRILNPEDHLQVYWHYLFVRQYYLDALPKDQEPDGFLGLWGNAKIDAQNVIPDQRMHTLGFTYAPAYHALRIGMQVKNIFDKAVFDNFRIQNPGRSIFLKLTYSLNNK